MSTSRLQQQFIRLWQRCHGETTDTTLQALAEVLSCSRRHVRSLLSAMQREGWLTWQAESGRGKRSRLTFHYTGLALQQQRAEELLEQDRIDQLVQLVGDKNVVRQMLLSQLGRSFRQGKHILRVLYYRQLYNLLPGSALRRSETHLARQIFNGLTRINEENGELESDLSHHWQALTPLHWRFYLRPAIHFHHGRELEMADVITSLSRLTSQPLFSHIESVTSPTPFVIDVQLRSPDHWLPWLLGSVQAMILPREWRELPDFARHPVGTGPYRMVRNHPSQMKIHAFDDYFGYRALIDEVNIWVLPEFSEELVHSGVQLQGDETGNSELESRLEEGCYFLLFDQRSPLAADPAIRSWLCELINPISLLSHAGPLYQRYWSPAYGLLPRWHHNRTLAQQPKPAGLTELTMTHFNEHSEFHAIRQAIEPLLAQHGIRLIVQSVDYTTWHQGDARSDLWLGSANFYLPLEFSLFATLYELPLMQHCMNEDLAQDAALWRANRLPLAEFCQRLVSNHQLHPLFHHWLQLHGQRSMRGVRMNTLGWFDFKSAWFAPPEA
ncbi:MULTISPECIES: HTH-type transcriptional regulator SgrR [Serratia]|jgi:SgrR family transcriptional regulator|uniref:HTH-type transcriptional regulator SgrR n=1 Tax=Serratia TaxID=613 RepID=UPI0011F23AEB|nr:MULTISPECIES: HTH-type transcriptional regulator SgrR [Serratia]MBH2729435.1 HTH-type transcriptional regulator SgrR [Serratia marcescens]NRN14471.1 HTH-type transcriptional regulator SgrR [Serratia marcescens]NRN37428.1 HTH-type transcriptional regulator SgrR [Serratia marcescens]